MTAACDKIDLRMEMLLVQLSGYFWTFNQITMRRHVAIL